MAALMRRASSCRSGTSNAASCTPRLPATQYIRRVTNCAGLSLSVRWAFTTGWITGKRRGSRMVKRAPPEGTFSTQIRPSCRLTIS